MNEGLAIGRLSAQAGLLDQLIRSLADREVYFLAYKLRMCDFTGNHTPDNPQLIRVLSMYNDPKNRLLFLQGLEALCGLPSGSLVNEYEKARGDLGLTRGALAAQVERFYELWGAYIFIDHSCWDPLSKDAKRHLQSVIETFFYSTNESTDPKIKRTQIEPSIIRVRKETQVAAFRAKFGNPPPVEKFGNFEFPSGLAFDIEP